MNWNFEEGDVRRAGICGVRGNVDSKLIVDGYDGMSELVFTVRAPSLDPSNQVLCLPLQTRY